MAEIRVQPQKKSRSWIWVLLLLLVLAAVGYYLYAQGHLGGRSDPAPVVQPAPASPAAPATPGASSKSMEPHVGTVAAGSFHLTSTGGWHGTA